MKRKEFRNNFRREVSVKEGQDLAKKWGMQFLESSVKNKLNVEESFIKVIDMKKGEKCTTAKKKSRGCTIF